MGPPCCAMTLFHLAVEITCWWSTSAKLRISQIAAPYSMDDLWDIVFSQQPGQEGLRHFGIPMPLEENVKHETVLVHGPPKPVSNAIDARTDLVELPP